jgi:hypothetical protein
VWSLIGLGLKMSWIFLCDRPDKMLEIKRIAPQYRNLMRISFIQMLLKTCNRKGENVTDQTTI